MTIYHFANESIGPSFFDVFQKIKEIKPKIKVVLVFSSLTYSRSLRALPFLLRWKLLLRYKKKHKTYDKLMLTSDINKANFSTIVEAEDLGIITGFNQIFSKRLISRFTNVINFHPSVLPYYRGPVPSIWIIRNGENSTGFTFHYITERIDEGEIIYQKRMQIRKGTTPQQLNEELSNLGAPVLKDIVMDIIIGNPIKKKTIQAEEVYNTKVNYRSFPKKI